MKTNLAFQLEESDPACQLNRTHPVNFLDRALIHASR